VSDSDYTLPQTLAHLGAVLRRVTDLKTGEILHIIDSEERRPSSAEVSFQDTARGGAPLSTVHKTPFVEWASGGGLLKVSKGIVSEAPKGGKRGKISGFSFASRRRLMQTIARIRLDAELPMFVTLTYPDKFPSPIESKKHMDLFRKRLLRTFPDIGYIWKLEPQERGAPHYHMLVWGVSEHDLFMFTISAWYEIAGGGDNNHLAFHMGGLGNKPCVQEVYSREGVMRYASKYLGKTFEVAGWDEVYPGRFWAVVQKDNIPFGQDMVMYITEKDAVTWMRYQKQFAKTLVYEKVWDAEHKKKVVLYMNGRAVVLKKKKMRSFSSPSLTIFSNADLWIQKIQEVHTEEKQ
jgi:hypothetical protein